MRYEIDVAREARDVYKGQRDSLRDEVSNIKSNCTCGATSQLKRAASTSTRSASSTSVKAAVALSPSLQGATISPRRNRSPPPMSFVSANASAPGAPSSSMMSSAAAAGGGPPPAMFNSSAPPASRQYVELDAIEMPGESSAAPSYDFVPNVEVSDPGSARYAPAVSRAPPPAPPPQGAAMFDDGNYRPLPMPNRAPALYVPVQLGLPGQQHDPSRPRSGF